MKAIVKAKRCGVQAGVGRRGYWGGCDCGGGGGVGGGEGAGYMYIYWPVESC